MSEDVYVLPASFGQERLWLLDQTQPNTPVYNIAGALRLRGPLDAQRLEACVAQVVDRHEVLRTTLRLDRDGVVQVIHGNARVPVEVVDVAGGWAQAVELAARLERRPFDLRSGPLLRCHLLRLAADDHLFVVVVHHAVSDGWSMGILLQELSSRYADPAPEAAAELPVQYADYAVWQRELVDSDDLDGQLSYWRDRLDGAAPLRLPPDREPPPVPTYGARVAHVELPAELVRRARGGATSFMAAMAAFAVVLARWSGQTDIVLAFPVAGRAQPELEPLVGFFVNTLPLRVQLDPDADLASVLDQVRTRCLEAYAHPDVPFELLVERLRPRRRAGQVPLAQAMLALNNTPARLTGMPGMTVEFVDLPTTHVQFDVLVDLTEQATGLRGVVVLHADVFDADTAALVASSLRDVLTALADAPQTAVGRVPCPVAANRTWPCLAPEPDDDEAPAGAGPESVAEPPGTPAEHLLARLWAEVLDRDVVGVTDEFYALGGNSMRAVRVVVQARELGLELPIELVLGEHTIRELASRSTRALEDQPVGGA